jgi:hypothetical protein
MLLLHLAQVANHPRVLFPRVMYGDFFADDARPKEGDRTRNRR